jgi:hypothetical protein
LNDHRLHKLPTARHKTAAEHRISTRPNYFIGSGFITSICPGA